MTELANRVELEVSKPFHKQSKSLLFELYKEAFGSLNGLSMGCSSCKHDAYVMLQNWLRSSILNLNKTKLNLFTSYYQDNSPKRQSELDFCLKINRESGLFDNVILIEHTRPTFKDFFERTKEYPSDVNIIANSDIFFNNTVLQCKLLKYNECYALSRWDYKKGGTIKHFSAQDSQDVWAFRGASRCQTGEFHLGMPGCDNRIAHEFKQAGYKVTNPSRNIRTIHLHLSDIKSYTNKTKAIDKPYMMVPVC